MTPTVVAGIPRAIAERARRSAFLIAAVVGIALCVAPFGGLSLFSLQVLTLVFLNATTAVGLSVSYGYAGMLNFSQASFAGIGAYTAAYLLANLAVPFEIAFPVACAAALVGGIILGLTTARVSGDYFSLVSLAFSIVVSQIFINWTDVTGGPNGFSGIPQTSLFGQPIVIGRSAYFATLGMLAICVLFVRRFAGTYAGRSLQCVRLDSIAAEAAGIKVFNTRLLALSISATIAGASGAMQVATVGFIDPSDFGLIVSFDILLWVIIGGSTSIPGIIAATSALTFATEEFRSLSDYSIGLTGILVLAAVLIRGGVARDWLLRWRAT